MLRETIKKRNDPEGSGSLYFREAFYNTAGRSGFPGTLTFTE
jgi:hypothetical protein